MRSLRLIPALGAAMLLAACASVGRPEGGPRDEMPPVYVRSNPVQGATGVDGTSFSIYFDENVQLDDAFNKVVISPVQIESPQVSANGRRVSVRLRDTLQPNTTYTIDFGDAIKDLNEGNVLDGFALDFSTGDAIDSMRISGVVLAASNLEPAQGMLVGAWANTTDTAIRTVAPARIARTNQRGQFTLRNLAPGPYRIYALNDLNRDWHWDCSEDVAFLDSVVVPDLRSIAVTDTLYSSTGGDSLIERTGVQYLPNDLLLTWFNQNYQAQYLKDYKRPTRRQVDIVLGAEPDSLPQVTIVDGVADSLAGTHFDRWAVPVWSARRDSLTLWLADSAVYRADSLRLAVRYRKPDSLEQLVWTTDTLRFFFRDPKKSKKELEADTLPPALDVLTIRAIGGTTQEVYTPLRLGFDAPLRSIDTASIHFEQQVDTLWTPIALPPLRPDSLAPVMQRVISYRWEPGRKYRLTIDSAAVVSVYGEHNRKFVHDFSVRALEDYANLTFRMRGADTTAVVELLNSSDVAVRTAPVGTDGRAVFRYVAPGKYYARMYFDTDANGEWTTGLLDSIQPEEVAYFPKKLELKRNWDIEQDWDIYELPVDAQKPYAILKNKPKLKRGEEAPRDPDEEDDDPLLGGSSASGRNNRNNNNRNNSSLGGFNGLGGLRQNNDTSGQFRR